MIRSTIDFGIDLGTTNSAIAVLKGVTPEIIKNNRDADITPSAVWLRKNGETYVGWEARNRNRDYPEEAYLEFKRRMGTDHQYLFKTTGTMRKPEELSAEVLKSLKGDVQQRTGELVEASVITVPAIFELHQCDATRMAAQLAGFKESPLLQEPVAAALAYGFQTNNDKTHWLVYDFGGGTFDAAVIKAEEGMINVVNHGGDIFLGGADMDWVIVEQLLVPRIVEQYGLKDFSRANAGSNGKWREVFARLKWNAEELKIALSRREKATLDTVKFRTSEGEDVEFETEISRSELVAVVEPIILRSIEICKRVLKEKNLSRKAIEKVILVGGPTVAPYFRDILTSNLGIPLEHRVDPLTVVAQGAAVFAGTQSSNPRGLGPVAVGEFSIELHHKPVGIDSTPMVGGKVSAASARDFSGFMIELINNKTQWRSGKIPLHPDGVFIANLHAERGERNTYVIELFDSSGLRQKVKPDTLSYTIGAVVEEQPLINSMGIALADNSREGFFEKGKGLPQKKTIVLKTVQPLRQGQSGEVLRIPVVEGENELGDRNRLSGVLDIRGDKIRRDLPAGSDVEVTLRIDESRIVTVKAYVPLLDEEFETKIEMRRTGANVEFLKSDFEGELKRFREAKSKAAAVDAESAARFVGNVEESPLLQEVKDALVAAKGDPDAAAKCERRLLELKLKLDDAVDALEWPTLIAEAKDWLSYLKRAADQDGNEQQKEKTNTLAAEIERIISERKAERLRKRIDLVRSLYWEILFAQPSFWVEQHRRMEREQAKMTDQGRAARLLDQGRDCMGKNNVIGLQNIVRQLWDLLPKEVAEAAKRGYESSLVR